MPRPRSAISSPMLLIEVATTRPERSRPRPLMYAAWTKSVWSPLRTRARLVGPNRPVRVPVVGDAERGAGLQDLGGQACGVERAAVPVDVPAVGGVVEGDDFEAEVAENARGDDRARAVRAVQDDAAAAPAAGRRGTGPPGRPRIPRGSPSGRRGRPARRTRPASVPRRMAVSRRSSQASPIFVPADEKILMPLSCEGIMGGRKDDPGREGVLPGQVGYGRRRKDPGRDGVAAALPENRGRAPLPSRPRIRGCPGRR